jgi:exopolyphosphatase/guanosine-5'-triphosphate,3'-diphosphate pyrophosphatase
MIVDFISLKKFKILKQDLKCIGLGRELDKNKNVSDEKIKTALKTLTNFVNISELYKVDKITVFGTEIFRKAGNIKKLVDLFFERAGYNIEILSGEKESELSFYGAVLSVSDFIGKPDDIAVLDIGAGSTEVSFHINNSGLIKSYSFPFGCATVFENFKKDLPYSQNNINKIDCYLKEKLNIDKIKFNKFVGVGGTVTALASIILNLKSYDNEKINGTNFSFDKINMNIDKILKMNYNELQKFPVLNDNRASIFPAGLIILKFFINKFNVKKMIVSDNGVLLGKIFESYKSKVL